MIKIIISLLLCSVSFMPLLRAQGSSRMVISISYDEKTPPIAYYSLSEVGDSVKCHVIVKEAVASSESFALGCKLDVLARQLVGELIAANPVEDPTVKKRPNAVLRIAYADSLGGFDISITRSAEILIMCIDRAPSAVDLFTRISRNQVKSVRLWNYGGDSNSDSIVMPLPPAK